MVIPTNDNVNFKKITKKALREKVLGELFSCSLLLLKYKNEPNMARIRFSFGFTYLIHIAP